MRFFFHPEADAEFDKVVDYYEQCQPGLGVDFAEDAYAAIARIIEYPESCIRLSANTRRCLLNRFPYGLIYQIQQDAISIIAVANLHKRPNY